ncbi:hypothetical protein D3C73_912650 [compost metagenome]
MALRQRQVGARLRQFGARHGIVQPNQHLAPGNRLAFLEFNGLDPPHHFRPQHDGFVRSQAAHGGQAARERNFLDGGNLDPNGSSRRGNRPGGALGGRGCAGRKPSRHENTKCGPRGQPGRDGGQQYSFFHARMWL